MNRFVAILLTLTLAACSTRDNGVQVTSIQPPPKPVAPGRTEPIFYNGKTYSLKFSPAETGGYLVAISGMTENQKKDASGLTISAFHHFYCKDSQSTKFVSAPSYAGGTWNAVTQCG